MLCPLFAHSRLQGRALLAWIARIPESAEPASGLDPLLNGVLEQLCPLEQDVLELLSLQVVEAFRVAAHGICKLLAVVLFRELVDGTFQGADS